jgi:branched-chain amino acid transport system permease protein
MAGFIIQQILNGLVLAGVYALLAVAFALVHAVTRRIVFTLGDLAMYAAFYAVHVALLAVVFDFASLAQLLIAFAAAGLGAAALAFLIQRLVVAPLTGNPSQALMIASIGLSIVVQEVMRISSGGRDQWLPPFFHETGIAFALGGYPVRISAMGLGVAGLAAALCLGLVAFMALTPAGRWWRAVSEDAGLAALSGIDVGRAVAMTFVAAGGFAAAAGGILAVHYGGVSFSMGLMLALKALFAGIIGGFGTISGAIAGALLLAALETAWQAAFDINYRDVAVFAVIILVLMLRPDGLLGRPLRIDQPDRAR